MNHKLSISASRKKKHIRENKKKLNERLGNKSAGLSDDTVEMDLFSLKAIANKQVNYSTRIVRKLSEHTVTCVG